MNRKKVIDFSGLILIIVIFIYGISVFDNLKLFTVIIMLMLISFGFFCNVKLIKDRKQLTLYCILFWAKFGLLIYDTAHKNLPLTSGDFGVYYNFANDIINKSNSVWDIISFSSGTDIYSKFNALSYVILENNYNLSYFFSFVFSLVISIYIYKTALLITKSEKKSTMIMILWMLTPLEVIYSITFLKEAFMQMLFIMSLYQIILFIKNGGRKNAIYAIILAGCNSLAHSGVISVVIVYIFFFAFYDTHRKKIKVSVSGILIILIFGGGILMSPAGDAVTSRFKGVENASDIVDRTQNTEGRTSYVSEPPENNIDLLIQTPYRFLMFAIAPLPWQINSVGTAIAFLLDGILQYCIFYFYLIYIFRFKPKEQEDKVFKILSVSILILTYLIYAWGTHTYGTAMRHRLKIYPMTIIIMYQYWGRMKLGLSKRRMQ